MGKKIRAVIAVLLIAATAMGALAGCKSKEGYPVTIGDVTIESRPDNVVALSPHLATALAQLGFSGQVIGVPAYEGRPSVYDETEITGDYLLPDIDKIIQLKPDLILTMEPLTSVDQKKLEDTKIQVVIFTAPHSLDSMDTFYRQVAMCMAGDLDDNAGAIYKAELDAFIEGVLEKQTGDRPSFAVVMPKGFIAGGDTLEGDLFARLLGENVAADKDGYAMSAEELLAANPDVLIVSNSYSLKDLQEKDHYKDMQAVIDGKVYFIDATVFEGYADSTIFQLNDVMQRIYFGKTDESPKTDADTTDGNGDEGDGEA